MKNSITSYATKKTASTSSRNRDVRYMERGRREKANEFFMKLQSMVPNLFPKATRTKIVDETISYIKTLEQVIAVLDAEKADRSQAPESLIQLLENQCNSSVSVTTSGNTGFFGIRFAALPGLMTKVLEVFEKHNAEVLTTTTATNDDVVNVTVSAILQGEETVDKIKSDLLML